MCGGQVTTRRSDSDGGRRTRVSCRPEWRQTRWAGGRRERRLDRMANYFHRQLGYYADAHRDRVNSVMHMIANPILFVAVVLPLSLLPVRVLGVEISAAPLLTIPAIILWMAWDITIGLAIAVTSIPLLFAAGAIAIHVSIPWVWLTAIGLFVLGWALQIIGHQLFEGKRPTLLDNPVQMLIRTYLKIPDGCRSAINEE